MKYVTLLEIEWNSVGFCQDVALFMYLFILISDMNKFLDYFKSVMLSANLCGKRLKFLNNHM